MSDLEQAKAKLIDTIGRYNLTVNNVAKFQFNDRETELFAIMMIEFAQEQANGVSDNHGKALPIQHVSSRFNLVADVMPAINEYVLIKTPYCKYPATVGFWNGVKWLAADDKCEIFNVSEWLSLNGC